MRWRWKMLSARLIITCWLWRLLCVDSGALMSRWKIYCSSCWYICTMNKERPLPLPFATCRILSYQLISLDHIWSIFRLLDYFLSVAVISTLQSIVSALYNLNLLDIWVVMKWYEFSIFSTPTSWIIFCWSFLTYLWLRFSFDAFDYLPYFGVAYLSKRVIIYLYSLLRWLDGVL